MKTYYVATYNKDTGELCFKHIDANNSKDIRIERYIDGKGNVLWAVYQPSIDDDIARYNFKQYIKHRLGRIHS